MINNNVLKNPYLRLILSNILFFGFFYVWMLIENIGQSGGGYALSTMVFTFSLFLYLIFYGYISYMITRRIILPNIILYLFISFISYFLFLRYNKGWDSDEVMGSVLSGSLMFNIISIFSSIIGKIVFLTKLKRQKRENE
jgi:hypothetical protein